MRFIQNIQGKAIAAALAVLGTFIVSCTTKIDTTPVRFGGQQYAPPTGLRALGAESSVILAWQPSPDADSSAFVGYSFTALIADTTPGKTDTLPLQTYRSRIDTAYTFTQLNDGVPDTFYIQSTATDGTPGPRSVKIVCAAARQYSNLQLFGLASNDTVMKGLQLFPDSVKAVFTAQEPDSVDLVFDDRTPGAFSIASANLKSSGSLTMPRQTLLNPARTAYASNLNDLSLADSVSDSLGSWQTANAVLGAGGNGIGMNGKGEVFFIKTQSGNYARIFIHSIDTLGTLYAKDTTTGDPGYGFNYITFDVSYQTTPGLPYSIICRYGTPKKPE